MSDPKASTEAEIKDLDGHINDVVDEALKHGHSIKEVAEALERAASDLAGREDDDEDAA
jgi:uncharacterized protein (UPF0335 family)